MTPTPAAPPDPTRPPVAHEPQRVAVTGADSGIGRACAVALAAPGRHVGVTWNMLQMGPMAGSHLQSHDWRRP